MYHKNHWRYRVVSTVLTLAFMIQLLPARVFAAETDTAPVGNQTVAPTAAEPVRIVEEVTGNRTEYSKEFKLSNGLHLAAVYNDPVHFEKDGQWQEIDNTLVAENTRSGAFYRNTAGVWEVSFPQTLRKDSAVTVTKGDRSLSFWMAGQLVEQSNAPVTREPGYSLTPVKETPGRIQAPDHRSAVSQAEYPETVYTKGTSRLTYAGAFAKTDIIYDLRGNLLKESIVMESHSAGLGGYRYALSAEGMVPVLQEDNTILFYAGGKAEVVMAMPAPFLIDGAGEICYDIDVILTPQGGSYTLDYILPQEWLGSSERSWPVVLDPVVAASLHVDNIRDVTVSTHQTENHQEGVLECGVRGTNSIQRIFLKYQNLPALSSSDVIVEAQVLLTKCVTSDNQRLVTAHKLLSTWESETVKWSTYFGSDPNSNFDPTVVDYLYVKDEGVYSWDITDIARGWYEGNNTGVMFRYGDEGAADEIAQFWSSDYYAGSTLSPTLLISFRNNNGLEGYWDYTTASAGRAGSGYINNYTGNLAWVRGDMGFGGNRMPVSISHVYNANDAKQNLFGMGYGWRTNFNQRVYQWSQNGSYYVWEDSDGTYHYFYRDGETQVYKDEDGLELTLEIINTTDGKYKLTDKNGNSSYFDTAGRLVKQANNQREQSSIIVTYDGSSLRIATVTDGAGRKYTFTYSNGLLSRIDYVAKGTTSISRVSYTYDSAGQLTGITDPDGKTATYTYGANHLLATVRDIDDYTLTFTYTNTAAGKPARVASVAEKWDPAGIDNDADGGSLTIEYAHNQTTFTDVRGNKQILQFNDWGNTVAIQDGEGRAQYAAYIQKSVDDKQVKANQLSLASKLQNTVGNMITNSSFEYDGVPQSSNYGPSNAQKYHGDYAFYITGAAGFTVSPHDFVTVANGETVTFSGYVNAEAAGARIGIFDGTAYVAISQQLPAGSSWTRMEVSYTNTTGGDVNVRGVLSLYTAGTAYIDCIQMEKSPTASRYNLVENGDFRDSSAWNTASGIVALTAAAPQLDKNVYRMTGNPGAENRISQIVHVRGEANDTFVLSGWAKGDSAPLRDDRKFSLIATFMNGGNALPFLDENGEPLTDENDEIIYSVTVDFNPDAGSEIAWQYAASALIAPGDYDSIKIELAYDYNVNTVYFDGIQLYKEQFGQSYTYDENGNVVAVRDIQGQETQYEYDDNNNLIKQTLPNGAVLEYTYDAYHNPVEAISGTGLRYGFTYDDYGNNTSVSIEDWKDANSNGEKDPGETVSITATAAYSGDGNRLVSNTDALGNTTTYSYNADTNVLEWVKYPGDTDDTKTSYTYDSMYRMATSAATTDTGSALSVNYTYTNDLLTGIQTPTAVYSLGYGAFGLRENIRVGNRTLATYGYTEETNDLELLVYGNNLDGLSQTSQYTAGNDWVRYAYDSYGRLTTEYRGSNQNAVTYRYDNSGGLAQVYDPFAERTTTYYYDFTDRLMKYAVTGSGFSHSVEYKYDATNKLLELVETVNGTALTTSYDYDKDNRVTSVTTTNGTTTVTEEYTYDDYGRLTTKVTKEGTTTVLTESYTYKTHNGAPTTQVATVTVTNGSGAVEYSCAYTYDAKGNIITAADNRYTYTYAYDSANQLIRENNPRQNKTWTWTYDNAGNILTKKEYAYTTGTLGAVLDTVTYTYGNSQWGDLLTGYDGQTLNYDTVGNIISDGTWTYTWEHGRQLASMTGNGTTWTFTYDADGMRTGRTNGTTTYGYTYNGGQLTQMTLNGEPVTFTYDASGKPETMTYQGETYYYVTNLQGDVVHIVDSSGTWLVHYYYTAYGTASASKNEDHEALSTTLIAANPLTYRGYVYDQGTSLYYLQSRYYNPTTGRFLNADALVSTGQGLLGNNMFAYCGNNPIVRSDHSGLLWDGLWNGIKDFIRGALHTANNVAVCLGMDTAGIGASLLDMYESSPGVYHAETDCWQQYFGYNDLYDVAFDMGTSMAFRKFRFSYGGTEYCIWVWKGDYINLGAGAEMGIYYGGGPHWLADTDLSMSMSMSLDYNGTTIILHDQYTWWITGFNSNYPNVQPGNLSATFTIFFNNPSMYYNFAAAWNGRGGWVCNTGSQSATLVF